MSGGSPPYAPPVQITKEHDASGFACGEPSLDDWLRRRALANQVEGASRTYVVTNGDSDTVVAYYCLAAGSLQSKGAPGRVRRNMPDPIPVSVLGRLAVDREHGDAGLGTALLRDAIRRSVVAARTIGIRAVLVHALNERAATFYERRSFQRSPKLPLTLALSLKGLDAEQA